jgi:phenylacetate-CoA ligase
MAVDVAAGISVEVDTGRVRDRAEPIAAVDDGWVVAVLRQTLRNVPAYARFLAERGVDPWRVRTIEDFRAVPQTNGPDYLRRFALEDLLPEGSFGDAWVISTDASSEGASYVVRGLHNQAHACAILGPVFEALGSRRRSTLSLVALGMGSEPAGTYHLQLMLGLQGRGHRITMVTPGTDIDESVRMLRELAPRFQQTIIQGSLAIVRELLGRAAQDGIDLAALGLGLILSGEPISEAQRDEMGELIAGESAERVRYIYDAAEIGVIGVETRATVTLRRLAMCDHTLRRELFGREASRCPAIVEYSSGLRHVEAVDGRLLFTVDGSIPLIRYRNGDAGEVLTPAELRDRAHRVLGDRAPVTPSRPCILLRSSSS